MPPQQQIYVVLTIIATAAVIIGVLSLFIYIYPWWYIIKKGKKAGLDDFTISQWRWKALWFGWLAVIQFEKYLKTIKRSHTSRSVTASRAAAKRADSPEVVT